MTFALITGIFGGYDTLKPLDPSLEIDEAICVTDDPKLTAEGWRTVVEEPRGRPIIQAKRPKMMPWLYTDHEFSMWIDGAMQLVSTPPIQEATKATGLAAFTHHHGRKHWADEAEFSAGLARYAHLPFSRQVRLYKSLGVGPGLWACGILLRRHTEMVRVHGETWLSEVLNWGEQDQISFPYACHFSRTWPTSLDRFGTVTGNPWTVWRGHLK